jgi:hypothetical protein
MKHLYIYIGSEILTQVTMTSTIFWDVTPCSLVEVCHLFKGMYYFHH